MVASISLKKEQTVEESRFAGRTGAGSWFLLVDETAPACYGQTRFCVHRVFLRLVIAVSCGSAGRVWGETLTPPAGLSAGVIPGPATCATSGCHGGADALSRQYVIWSQRDVHSRAYATLTSARAARMGEALNIAQPAQNASCTACHAPLQTVAPTLLASNARIEDGVTCVSCHGTGEGWLRSHTRPDFTHADRVSAGMRELRNLYGRANTCVACHLNLDAPIRRAGHPELYFELDGQALAEPPHYKDERPSLGQRQWLTGQAAALRELSWKLAAKRDDALVPRWKALVWLLRKTEAGKKELPAGEDFGAVQSAADQLARNAAKTLWTKEQTAALLKEYLGLRAEFSDPKADKAELRRRAEVLVPALDRLWRAYRKETGAESADFGPALDHANLIAREGEDFEPAKFVSALEELQAAWAKGAK